MDNRVWRLPALTLLALCAFLALPAQADSIQLLEVEPKLETESNVMTVLISHDGAFQFYEGEGGSPLTLVIIGSWGTELGFPDLVFNPQFPVEITPLINDPGNEVRFLGFFGTNETAHQIQDVPDPLNPGSIDRAVQTAISNALLNIHALIGPGEFGTTTVDQFIAFVVGFSGGAVTEGQVANVVFNTATASLGEGDGFSEAEGVVFPFTPLGPLGTFSIRVGSDGGFASTFQPVPEPGLMALVLLGGVCVVRRRRRARACA
jgi:hypothetical protein